MMHTVCIYAIRSEMYEIYRLNIYYDRLYTNVSIYYLIISDFIKRNQIFMLISKFVQKLYILNNLICNNNYNNRNTLSILISRWVTSKKR